MLPKVKHICPDCRATQMAPTMPMTSGNAGIWVCPQCDAVWDVNVRFDRISDISDLETAQQEVKHNIY